MYLFYRQLAIENYANNVNQVICQANIAGSHQLSSRNMTARSVDKKGHVTEVQILYLGPTYERPNPIASSLSNVVKMFNVFQVC